VCASFVFFALTSCTVPATQTLVRVDTDFYVPTEIDTIRVRVLHETERTGGPEEDRAFEVPPPLDATGEVVIATRVHEVRLTEDFALGPAANLLPLELSLVPREGDASRQLRVEAYALRDGVVRATASLRARFVRHATARLRLVIYVACETVRCEPDSTCGPGGACIPNERPEDCVSDPARCPDAWSAPPDASRDTPLPALPDTNVDAATSTSCGDDVWVPSLEQCDGTADCAADCTLIAPITRGTCADPIVLDGPRGTWSGSFVGRLDEVRPLSRFYGGTDGQRGREVVYALDLATPTDLQARVGAGATTLVTTVCPTTGATPRVTLGAAGASVVAERARGRLYVVVDETASVGAYEHDYTLELLEPAATTGAGTCVAPHGARPAGLLRFLDGTEPATYEPECGGVSIPSASREVFFDAQGFSGPRTLWAAASDTTPAVGWIADCGQSVVPACRRSAPSHPEFARLYREPLSGAEGTRFFVDGLTPSTQWVALWID
jgi:hypothetical protein